MTTTDTITLPMYQGRGKTVYGTFRAMTVEEAKVYTGSHIWFLSLQNDARRAKVNGKIRTWKRDPNRVEIPCKYGMYECGTFTTDDIQHGRVLIQISE